MRDRRHEDRAKRRAGDAGGDGALSAAPGLSAIREWAAARERAAESRAAALRSPCPEADGTLWHADHDAAVEEGLYCNLKVLALRGALPMTAAIRDWLSSLNRAAGYRRVISGYRRARRAGEPVAADRYEGSPGEHADAVAMLRVEERNEPALAAAVHREWSSGLRGEAEMLEGLVP